MDALDKYLAMGATPVGPGDVVHRKMYTPPTSYGDYGDIPGVASGSQIPETGGYFLDKADPARTVSIGTGPDAMKLELPTIEQQHLRAASQRLDNLRNPQNQEAVQVDQRQTAAGTAAKSRSEATGRLDAAEQERQGPAGVPVPAALDEYLPGISQNNGQPRRALPGPELDKLINSAGKYADLTSKATNRGQPKVVKSELSRDDQGNQVQINSNDDGTVTEVPVTAKGVTAKPGANGQPTPYQQFQMNRATNNDAAQRVKGWQDKLDKLQGQSESLWAEKQAADDDLAAMNQQLTERTSGILGTGIDSSPKLKGSERFQLQGKINELKKKSSAAAAKAAGIDAQKRQVDIVRRSIMKANGMDGDTGGGSGAPAVAPAEAPLSSAPKSATRAQVQAYSQRYAMSEQEAMDAFKKDGIAVR
jgi:hypothetical protein